jgi:hypothetical protein
MAGLKSLFNTQFGRVLASLATAVPSADNEGREPSLTPQGALWVALDGVTPVVPSFPTKTYYSSGNILAQGLVFTGPCDIITIFGSKNNIATLRYLQLFDSIVAPVLGAIPNISIALPVANTSFSITYPIMPQTPRQFATGLYFGLSTTQNTFTLAPTGLVWVNAEIGS